MGNYSKYARFSNDLSGFKLELEGIILKLGNITPFNNSSERQMQEIMRKLKLLIFHANQMNRKGGNSNERV